MAPEGPENQAATGSPAAKEGLFSGSGGARQAAAAGPAARGRRRRRLGRRIVLVIGLVIGLAPRWIEQGFAPVRVQEGRRVGIGDRQFRKLAQAPLAPLEARMDELTGLGIA